MRGRPDKLDGTPPGDCATPIAARSVIPEQIRTRRLANHKRGAGLKSIPNEDIIRLYRSRNVRVCDPGHPRSPINRADYARARLLVTEAGAIECLVGGRGLEPRTFCL